MRTSLRMMVMFLTIFSLIYGSGHLYVWWRLVHPLKLTGATAWAWRIVFVLLFLSFPVVHFVFRQQNGPVLMAANYLSAVWMGLLLYLTLGAFGYDLLRLLTWGRLPVGRVMTVTVTVLAVAVTVYGLIEAHAIGVTRLTVSMANLPASLAGLRIVQVSDVHLGRIVRGARLEKIVTTVNELQPDLIVVTGDFVDAEPSHAEDLIPVVRQWRSRYGVFAVAGNHEFFAGIERTQAFFDRAGVTLLRNRWVEVAGGLQLIGRDDPVAQRITGMPMPSLAEITRGLDRTKPAVLLYHTPVTTLGDLAPCGIQLQLSGHTHRGQLWPFQYIVRRVFSTPYGLFTDGRATIYVSRGTGTWGPPVRVGARPEITLVTLTGSR